MADVTGEQEGNTVPSPDERVIIESEGESGGFGALKRLFLLAVVSVVAITLLVLAVEAPLDPQNETIDQLLARLCVQRGPDYVSECRLLRQRLCNQPALETAIGKLRKRKDHLSAARLGEAFLDQCDEDRRMGLFTAQDYFRLTDFEQALTIINRFPEDNISHAHFASWRGFILEKLGRHEEAALDLERSLYLFTDISNVAGSQFYYVTKALKAAGKYCEAIAPLQLFISFDPAARITTQIEQEIQSLRARGNCEPDAAPGRKTVKLAQKGGLLLVKAVVNGAEGTFILDTGASTVHLTREFAHKANIPGSRTHRIIVQGVTGSREDYFGIIRHVAVEAFVARNVRATIASVDGSLPAGIDGLLGQTFLSRFRFEVSGAQLWLSPL